MRVESREAPKSDADTGEGAIAICLPPAIAVTGAAKQARRHFVIETTSAISPPSSPFIRLIASPLRDAYDATFADARYGHVISLHNI